AALIAALGLLLVAAIATVAAVRLGKERDTALAASAAAENAATVARDAQQQMLLNHAELLLTTDPTATVAALEGYTGDDALRRQLLAARARGAGVAKLSSYPHVDTINLVASVADGGVLSIGEDQLVIITHEDGEREVLARDAHQSMVAAYGATTDLLAYARYPRGVALIHVARRTTTSLSDSERLRSMSATPDGLRLAVATTDGNVVVWDMSSRSEIARSSQGTAVFARWLSPDLLAVVTSRGIDIVDAQLNVVRREIFEKITRMDAALNSIVLIDGAGRGLILQSSDTRRTNFEPCSGPASTVAIVTPATFVVACRNGVVTIWDVMGRKIDTLATLGTIYCIHASDDGRHVVLAGEARTVFLYDSATRIMHRFRGHPSPILAIRAPQPGSSFILSADGHGTVRVWPLPVAVSRLAFRAPTRVYGTEFTPDGRALVADANDGVVRVWRVVDGSLMELHGHTGAVFGTRFASSRNVVASFGYDGTIREWNLDDGASVRVLKQHEGRVVDVRYRADGTALSAGIDGSLLAWAPDSTSATVWHLRPAALYALKLLADDSAVVYDADNNVWIISGPDRARLLTSTGSDMIRVMRASPDDRTIIVGTSSGQVIEIDIATGTSRVILETGAPVRDVVASTDRAIVAVASEDGIVHVRKNSVDTWIRVPARARFLSLSTTATVLAVTCLDGDVWFNVDEQWLNVEAHAADTESGYFSPDDRWFVTSDVTGRVVLHDLAMLRAISPSSQESDSLP
ncbi:MAG: hypothetical protein H0V89_14810, partial [Deltaproteobacteria bacterium]|nr:hypothetical protein [Deltaproteobacteria bacterium]